MILVYYRRQDGSIRTFHEYRAEKTLDEVRALAVTYNQEQDGKEEAHVVQYEEDSFEAHLFKASQQRKVWDKEMVQDLICSLQSALDAAYDLEGTT